jgi:hypothetical protein
MPTAFILESKVTAKNSCSEKGFANTASWICVLAAIALPVVCWLVAFSRALPSDRKSASALLFIFVYAQAAALLLGIISFFKIRKGEAAGVIARSTLGIVIGTVGGVAMFYLSALAGVGP